MWQGAYREIEVPTLLFQNVIWPAVAGNVAWAFFTVLIQEWGKGCQFYSSRLFLLGALAIYLCLDWTHTHSSKALRRGYWIGDLFLAPAIAAIAIAAQAPVGDGRWFLVAVFTVSTIAHLCGAWAPNGDALYKDGKWKHRFSWLALNGVAAWIAIYWGGPGQEWDWNLFAAAMLVIICWALAKPGNVRFFKWLGDQ